MELDLNSALATIQNPGILGSIFSFMTGIMWIALKRLIRDVRKSINGITVLSTKLDVHQATHKESEKITRRYLEDLSNRVQHVETGIAILERDFKSRKSNGVGHYD